MGIIEDMLGKIDTAVLRYNETVFNGFAAEAVDVFQAAGTLGLALIGVNMVLQVYPMTMASGIFFMLRFAIVTLLAASWDNFEFIYDILTDFPSRAGAQFLDAAGIGSAENLNASMDDIVTFATEQATKASSQSSLFGVSILGVVIGLIAGAMAAVSVLILALGKIGLAFAVSVAPIALLAYLFNFTNSLFRRWTEMTVSFAIIPLVVAAVMAAVVGVAFDVSSEVEDADTIGAALPMIVIILAAIFMMARVPQIVAGMAGSLVAGSGLGEGRQTLNSAGGHLGGAARGMRAVGTGSVTAARATASGVSQAAGSVANATGSQSAATLSDSAGRLKASIQRMQRRNMRRRR